MKKTYFGKLLTLCHNFVVDKIYRFLPDKQVDICEYLMFQGRMPRLDHPITFTEKLQWAKIHGRLERYSKYVDKYQVRDYVGKVIGQNYLVPLFGVWNSFDDIPFAKLPRRFVLIATHGSHYVYVCKDKSSIDMSKLKKTVERWLHENFYKKYREKQYRDCKPRIMGVRYLEEVPDGLTDFKVYCFNGKPHFIELVTERSSKIFDNFLDLNWKKLPVTCVGYYSSDKIPIKRPRVLENILSVAGKLSKPFPFVRVDLYCVKNRIYFGELTFTPGNGVEKLKPPAVDYQLGKLLDLSKYNPSLV